MYCIVLQSGDVMMTMMMMCALKNKFSLCSLTSVRARDSHTLWLNHIITPPQLHLCTAIPAGKTCPPRCNPLSAVAPKNNPIFGIGFFCFVHPYTLTRIGHLAQSIARQTAIEISLFIARIGLLSFCPAQRLAIYWVTLFWVNLNSWNYRFFNAIRINLKVDFLAHYERLWNYYFTQCLVVWYEISYRYWK